MNCCLKVPLYIIYSIFFIPLFIFLLVLGAVKVLIFAPFVFLIIGVGDVGIVIGLWPVHLFWSAHCISKSKKFGYCFTKLLLILLLPVPIALWTVVGVVGSVIMGIGYGIVWPVLETFKAVSKPGFLNKLLGVFTDSTWTSVWGACTIVRDFGDFSFHSYFSVMDELLEVKDDEKPIDFEVTQMLGYALVAVVGILVDVPLITLVVLYKSPILLFKGWKRLFEDLIGRSGPFLETVCVPVAGISILLWPLAVVLAICAGILASVGFGCYAAVIAFQEKSMKKGLLYVVACVSVFDEYTNDFLYLREGSCFPRPKYREGDYDSSPLRPLMGLHEQIEAVHAKPYLTRTPSEKIKALKAVVIWDNFFEACEGVGKELLRDGAIDSLDLEAWLSSKSKIVNIGIPSCAFVRCFLQSIKSGSTGFVMRDSVEMTSLNRPEGRVFDWLFEPMCVMKEQIRSLNLVESEELYMYKLALYCGDTQRVEAWQNGGVPPHDEIRRAQIEGISRRLQGFCLTLSRLPTFRRRFYVVVNRLIHDLKQYSQGYGDALV